jgi:hypothetical protein
LPQAKVALLGLGKCLVVGSKLRTRLGHDP